MADLMSEPAVMRLVQKLRYAGDASRSPAQIRKLKRQAVERVIASCRDIKGWQDRLPEFWGYHGSADFVLEV